MPLISDARHSSVPATRFARVHSIDRRPPLRDAWVSITARTLTMFAGLLLAAPAAALPAFPTAEGYGADSIGGRGGVVIYVDSLEDSGPSWPSCVTDPAGCTLRSALRATVPRTVLFRVSGTIELEDVINLKSEHSFLTLAGQTAPGDGIQLKNFGIVVRTGTHDVIIRYIRVRPGMAKVTPTDFSRYDAIELNGVRDVIVDHCSMEWGPDETMSVWQGAQNVTVQWSIIAEGALVHAFPGFPAGSGLGLIVGGQPNGPTITLSFHHNLLAHNEKRSPRVAQGARIDIRNNVVYNWLGQEAAGMGTYQSRHEHMSIPNIGSPELNFVNNYYKAGPDSSSKVGYLGGLRTEIFLDGNVFPNCNGSCPNPWDSSFGENSPQMKIADPGKHGVRPLKSCTGTCVVANCRDCFPAGDGMCVNGPQDATCSGGTCNGGPFAGSSCTTASHCWDNGRGCEIRGATLKEKFETQTEFAVPGVSTSSPAAAFDAVLEDVGASLPIRDSLDARIVNETRQKTGALGCGATGTACKNSADWPVLRTGTPATDSDRDGIPDAWETAHGLNPNDRNDGNRDANGNGYTDLEDYLNGLVFTVGEPPGTVSGLRRDDTGDTP